ncbi:MAG TPA: hypothetical protein VNU26_17205, partial [Mycobacteriales bacterium]|nr:hypothetical protein [Mycobacteriales bacterium]
SPRPAALRALVGLTSLAVAATGTAVLAAPDLRVDDTTPARTVPFQLTEDRPVDNRLPAPEDRYAMASGCYTLQAPGEGWIARDGDDLTVTDDAATAVPLHFQATRLGEYLLATNEGRDARWAGAWWDVRGFVSAAQRLPGPLADAADGVAVATEPSQDGEWRVVAAGADPEARGSGARAPRFAFTLPARDAALAVADGEVKVVPGGAETATPLVLQHVRDDDPTDADPNGTACATWPEIDTGTSGDPQPVAASEVDRARGFFEAHVHGMAFEFLGGELRCGRPWHEYGVEFALGGCDQEGKPLNQLLEVPLGGNPPGYAAEYDPVGWPTFSSWPRNRTLTHEQFYWRWLERAHAGGLRLLTNLLVDNTALCQVYPQKKNSCNEMDGVRLQAQRLFELQDYIDAQNGGPGEGWLRIVTSPAQARQVINDGRLAVVLGIEISELFDCREVLDQPQCTEEQIDERLQEVFDMGVRQMELVNKFDNALSGVTGDGGTTGPVVNTGNRHVTGHWWDMRSCEPEGHGHEHGVEGDEHDKRQIVPTDATPGDGEGVDALAGRILDQFGGLTSIAAPVYGPGPHCNTRGLTDLGRHLVTRMVEKGMIFDPDHMSAKAQREALDLIENELWPAELERAEQEGRPPVKPAVISSHSWANDVIYQRIYRADGQVAPRTDAADGFVESWVQHRAFAARNAPVGHDFGLGYGADTNGLGGQPGVSQIGVVDYESGWEAPIGGVRFERQVSGLQEYDVNTEGVSHYGLFADWYEQVARAADEIAPELGGGEAILDDMLDGAETYLRLWERAVYGGGDCVTDGSALQVEDLHAALGLNLEGFLTAVGQPVDREGAAYRYCVEDDDRLVYADVTFDDGRTAAVEVAGPVDDGAADEGGDGQQHQRGDAHRGG